MTAGGTAPIRIGVSTKAYFGWHRSLQWLDAVAALLAARGPQAGVELFVIPSDPVLAAAVERLGPLGVAVGAQDAAWGEGPLTGETPAGMLAEIGVGIVELGHAERRALLGETDGTIARKLTAVLDAGLLPLLCVGELQRGAPEQAIEECRRQVLAALGDRPARIGRVAIAYEPVWAIGRARPAGAPYVSAVVDGLRAALADAAGAPAWIVYGGSAGPGMLVDLAGVDGLFLGRRAHDPAGLAGVLDDAAARLAGSVATLAPR